MRAAMPALTVLLLSPPVALAQSSTTTPAACEALQKLQLDGVALTVTKTSGHEVLDRQAQEMFRSAAADVPVPPVLRGKQFAVDVAVDYYFTD